MSKVVLVSLLRRLRINLDRYALADTEEQLQYELDETAEILSASARQQVNLILQTLASMLEHYGKSDKDKSKRKDIPRRSVYIIQTLARCLEARQQGNQYGADNGERISATLLRYALSTLMGILINSTTEDLGEDILALSFGHSSMHAEEVTLTDEGKRALVKCISILSRLEPEECRRYCTEKLTLLQQSSKFSASTVSLASASLPMSVSAKTEYAFMAIKFMLLSVDQISKLLLALAGEYKSLKSQARSLVNSALVSVLWSAVREQVKFKEDFAALPPSSNGFIIFLKTIQTLADTAKRAEIYWSLTSLLQAILENCSGTVFTSDNFLLSSLISPSRKGFAATTSATAQIGTLIVCTNVCKVYTCFDFDTRPHLREHASDSALAIQKYFQSTQGSTENEAVEVDAIMISAAFDLYQQKFPCLTPLFETRSFSRFHSNYISALMLLYTACRRKTYFCHKALGVQDYCCVFLRTFVADALEETAYADSKTDLSAVASKSTSFSITDSHETMSTSSAKTWTSWSQGIKYDMKSTAMVSIARFWVQNPDAFYGFLYQPMHRDRMRLLTLKTFQLMKAGLAFRLLSFARDVAHCVMQLCGSPRFKEILGVIAPDDEVKLSISNCFLSLFLRSFKLPLSDSFVNTAATALLYALKESSRSVELAGRFDFFDNPSRNARYESWLLLVLCSTNQETILNAINCFKCAALLGNKVKASSVNMYEYSFEPSSFARNSEVYAKMGSDERIITGKMFLYKRIRRVMQQSTLLGDGPVLAWAEIYCRFLKSSPYVRQSTESDFNDMRAHGELSLMLSEWENYLGLLASLGGALSSESLQNLPYYALQDIIDAKPPERVTDGISCVYSFLLAVKDFLYCPNGIIRDYTRAIIKFDLHPSLVVLFISVLQKDLYDRLSKEPHLFLDQKGIVLLELLLSVLVTLLKQAPESFNPARWANDGVLLYRLAMFFQQNIPKNGNERLRVQFCKLCVVLNQKSRGLALLRDIKTHRSIITHLRSWFQYQDGSKEKELMIQGGGNAQALVAQRELSCEALSALASLLQSLHADFLFDTRSKPSAYTDNEIKSYVWIFKGSASICLNISNMVRPDYESEKEKRAVLELQKDAEKLRSATVLGLKNLFLADLESTLNESMDIAMDPSPLVRSIFIDSLSQSLNEADELTGILKQDIDSLIDLICEPRLALSVIMSCSPQEATTLGMPLTKALALKGQTSIIFKAVVGLEFTESRSAGDVFRGNTISTKLISSFSKLIGSDYLKGLIDAIMMDYLELGPKYFELDPSRLFPGETLKDNQALAQAFCQRVIDRICDSADHVPSQLRAICFYILKNASLKFPSSRLTCVGAFVFLRFICPAIVAPQPESSHGNYIEGSRARRGLMHVAKVLQSLASSVSGEMKGMPHDANNTANSLLSDGSFVSENVAKISDFLEKIAVLTETSTDKLDVNIGLTNDDEISLHAFIYNERLRICNQIERASEILREDLPSPISSNDQLLRSILNEIQGTGPPVYLSNDTTEPSERLLLSDQESINEPWKTYLMQFSEKGNSTSDNPNIIYRTCDSKTGNPVIYCALASFDNKTMHASIIIYQLLKCLESVLDNEFELLVDASSYGGQCDIPSQYVQLLFSLLPQRCFENCGKVYVLNINTLFRRKCKKYLRSLSLPHFSRLKTIFVTDIKSLEPYLEISKVKWSDVITTLQKSSGVVFRNVIRTSQLRSSIPVEIIVGPKYIQIKSVEEHDLFNGYMGALCEVFELCRIDDIQKGEQADSSEFSIILEGGSLSIGLSSRRKSVIIQTIYEFQSRCHESCFFDGNNHRPNLTIKLETFSLFLGLISFSLKAPQLSLDSMKLVSGIFDGSSSNSAPIMTDNVSLYDFRDTRIAISISSEIAAKRRDLTLPFLLEVLSHYDSMCEVELTMASTFMLPWISNLWMFATGPNSKPETIRLILRGLIDLCVHKPATQLQYLYGPWLSIAKQPEVLEIAIDELSRYGLSLGTDSLRAKFVSQVFSNADIAGCRGRILSRIRKAIFKSAEEPTLLLVENSVWNEISVLLYLAKEQTLSTRHQAYVYLADIIFIIAMTAGWGDMETREWACQLTTTALASVCEAEILASDRYLELQKLFADFEDTKKVLFGLPLTVSQMMDLRFDSKETISLETLDSLCQKLVKVLLLASPNRTYGEYMCSRLSSLVLSAAFERNPAIQTRCFLLLGRMTFCHIDDNLVSLLVEQLHLELLDLKESNSQLLESILFCLSRVTENMKGTSSYLAVLYWISLSLMHGSNIKIYHHAIDLMEAVLSAHLRLDINLVENCQNALQTLNPDFRLTLTEIVRVTQLDFINELYMGLVTVLYKGARDPYSRDRVITVTGTCIDLLLRWHDKMAPLRDYLSGFLCYFVAFHETSSRVPGLMRKAGFWDEDSDTPPASTFKELEPEDPKQKVLISAFLIAMMNASQTEYAKRSICIFLASLVEYCPQLTTYMLDDILPYVSRLLTNPESSAVVDGAMQLSRALLENDVSHVAHNVVPLNEQIRSYRFTGLLDNITFHGSRPHTKFLYQLCGRLALASLGEGKQLV